MPGRGLSGEIDTELDVLPNGCFEDLIECIEAELTRTRCALEKLKPGDMAHENLLFLAEYLEDQVAEYRVTAERLRRRLQVN